MCSALYSGQAKKGNALQRCDAHAVSCAEIHIANCCCELFKLSGVGPKNTVLPRSHSLVRNGK